MQSVCRPIHCEGDEAVSLAERILALPIPEPEIIGTSRFGSIFYSNTPTQFIAFRQACADMAREVEARERWRQGILDPQRAGHIT